MLWFAYLTGMCRFWWRYC